MRNKRVHNGATISKCRLKLMTMAVHENNGAKWEWALAKILLGRLLEYIASIQIGGAQLLFGI